MEVVGEALVAIDEAVTSLKSKEPSMSNPRLDDSTNFSEPGKSRSIDNLQNCGIPASSVKGVSSGVLTVDVSVTFSIIEPTGWLLELTSTNDNVIRPHPVKINPRRKSGSIAMATLIR